MEARIVQLPTNEIRVDADRIVIERFVLRDPALAAMLAQREPADRPAVIERALKVGLLAIQDVAVSIDVDVVRDEFEKLLRASEQANARAAEALDQVLRSNFADGDGRLPRTLEKFLGDRGALRTFVGELFDETKRDSAIGRMRTLLGTYFDGDASKLALLLDPTRQNSPMHQFRTEVARSGSSDSTSDWPRSRPRPPPAARSAPGRPRRAATSRTSLEALLGDLGRGARRPRSTGPVARPASLLRSKKGDFVVTVDPSRTGGAEVRVVVEAKDRPMSIRSIREELREAKQNRGRGGRPRRVQPGPRAHRASRRSMSAPATSTASLDPAAPDPAILEAALRLARLLAIASLREVEAEIDVEAIRSGARGGPRRARGAERDQGHARPRSRRARRRPGGARPAARGHRRPRGEAEAEIRAARIAHAG